MKRFDAVVDFVLFRFGFPTLWSFLLAWPLGSSSGFHWDVFFCSLAVSLTLWNYMLYRIGYPND